MRASSWTVIEPSLPALTYTYVFGPGIANALAEQAEKTPPTLVVPCQGEPARPEGPAAAIKAAVT